MMQAAQYPEALITVVDDEPANVALLKATLRRAGYANVESFTNGEDALAALSERLSDVILLDVNMPGMPGTEVLAALRSRFSSTFVPVIILTANSDSQTRDQALTLGAIDFLVKPFNMTELLLRVGNVIRTRKLQVAVEQERSLLEERVAERTRELVLTNEALVQEKQAVERMRAAEQELERRLRHLAFHDPLTGLGNRARLTERLQESLTTSRYPTGLLLLDVDDFKSLNDAAGHAAGDEALRRVADVLTGSIEPSDVAARLGGDEFAVLTCRPDPQDYLYRLAERVTAALGKRFTIASREVSISCSIGLSAADPREAAAAELMRRADVALYAAKSRKPSPPVPFDPSMDDALLNRLAMVSDFHDAVAQQQFRLYYQPIVRLTTGAPVGFEALIRWDHPFLGQLSPDKFIPISEDSGWIRGIGRWATNEAIRFISQAHRYPGMENAYISVNASPVELREPDFAVFLHESLEKARVAPRHFVVEVTERVAINSAHDDRALAMLSDLRDVGIGVALDDFGTGYSSLSYLRQMPLTTLKIDKSFVQGIGRDGREEQITSCIIALARAMALSTTAEGIEELGQARWLDASSCINGQGYYFGRPMTSAAAHLYLREFTQEAA